MSLNSKDYFSYWPTLRFYFAHEAQPTQIAFPQGWRCSLAYPSWPHHAKHTNSTKPAHGCSFSIPSRPTLMATSCPMKAICYHAEARLSHRQ